ncbi:hypothetical protein AC579_836 [Pseudocercospora musae]|uniref:Uncharacterized protein n=1 Tax=Pseudocercospora musae TaxID=113226 RepID=A0A139I993_9PEZI|nr:hypothetical protein AC579_836 [Pseudocercospora musae]
MGTKPAGKKSKKSTQEPPPRNPPVEWTFTKKFLPELLEEPYYKDREAMLAWIRELRSPLRNFCDTELSGARYQTLGRILTNDEEEWLRQVPEMVDKAMDLSTEDIAAGQAAGFDTGDPATDRDMHIVSIIRRICDSDGMPIPTVSGGRSRAGKERARLRYSVAYRLLLTALSNLQQVPNGDFQLVIGTSAIQQWPDDIESSSLDSDDTATSSQKRSPPRSPEGKREAKKRKNTAATPNASQTHPQLQQEAERGEEASTPRSNAGADAPNDENDSTLGSAEDVEEAMEEDLITYLRGKLDKEERLRKKAEAKLTAVREAINALETAVERVKAAVQDA